MSQALPAELAGPPGGAWRAGWASLPDAPHAEWTKLRTVAGPAAWLLAATVVLTVAVSAAATAAVRHRLPGGHHQAQPHRDHPG